MLASNSKLQDVYIEEWKRFMGNNLSPKEIDDTVQMYHAEDRPRVLMDELGWLKDAGFKEVDVICKYYNGAVYGGIKM